MHLVSGGMPLIGRGEEMAAIAAFVQHATDGPGAMLIEGEAGIGKTSLWASGLAAAGESGMRILVARPTESEARLSYAALRDLADEAFDDVSTGLPALQREALEVALLRRESVGDATDHRAISAAILDVLRLLGRASPVLIAIDDVQWLDTPTARVLEFALRRLEDEPVRLLASMRVTGPVDLPLGLDGLVADMVRRLALSGLDIGPTIHMVRTRVDADLPRLVIRRIHAASRGNPLAALEMANAARRHPVDLSPESPLPVPEDLEALVRSRLPELPAEVRDVLLLIAASRESTVDLLRRAAEQPDAVADAVARAEQAGLVRLDGASVKFTHPLYASAVYTAAFPAKRRAAHGRLARVAVDQEEIARHLALAAEAPDELVALALERAARGSDARGAPDGAAELMEMAARTTPEGRPDAAFARATEAAGYLIAAGERARATAMLERLIEGAPSGPNRARALRLLGEARATGDSFPAAVVVLTQALAEGGDDPAVRAPILLDLAYATWSSGDVVAGSMYAEEGMAVAERIGDPAVLAEALSVRAVVRFLMGGGVDEETFRRAIAIEDRARRIRIAARPTFNFGVAMGQAGRLRDARPLLEEVAQRCRELGEESEATFPTYFLAQAECAMGDLAQAALRAEGSLQSARQVGESWALGLALNTEALVGAHRGPTDRASAAIREAIDLYAGMGWAAGLGFAAHVGALIAMSVGDLSGALSALGPLVDMAIGAPANPWVIPFGPNAVEALVAVGDLDRAGLLLERLEGFADPDGEFAVAGCARGRGLIAAASGEFDEALHRLGEAISVCERSGMRFELGRALLIEGDIERRARRPRLARATLLRAGGLFDDMGARPWADLTEARLARLGGRVKSQGVLTRVEEAAARLAAGGRTNAQIAGELGISVRTVEAHLSAGYRKLGIRSRAQLASALSGTADLDR